MSGKVLFVDDEKNVLRAVERIFIDDDIELLFAGSATEALDVLERHPDVVVVVSDYRMPGMNGVELLREVYRRHPRSIRMVLSGFADTSAVVDAINVGHITRFIPKPWNEDELRNAVLQALAGGDGEQARSCGPFLRGAEILDALPVGVLLAEETGAVRFMNRTAAVLCGWESGNRDLPSLQKLHLLPLPESSTPARVMSIGGRRCLVSSAETQTVDRCMILVLTPLDGGEVA